MNLYEKIITIYPELKNQQDDFIPSRNIIVLQDDSDGRGAYIKVWNHPIYPRPTDEQLENLE